MPPIQTSVERMNTTTAAERLLRARESLEGLSVGDAIGEALSYRHDRCRENCDFSVFRPGTVRYTDDTAMALAIVETLQRLGGIDEDALAWAFSTRYRRDPERGYGKMARRVIEEIGAGTPWREASRNAFGGGSFGNGAAMRVAPLGAYYAHDLSVVPAMATKSAQVTHFHPEGIAGAIAVAVAAAVATGLRELDAPEAAKAIWEAVLDLTPESKVRARLMMARGFRNAGHKEVSREVGNGTEVSAQDTVPFCIWSACLNLGNFREAVLGTLEVGGDCDTNCAIVGGVVSAYSAGQGIPEDWLTAREAIAINR